jgi:hypothetical protein
MMIRNIDIVFAIAFALHIGLLIWREWLHNHDVLDLLKLHECQGKVNLTQHKVNQSGNKWLGHMDDRVTRLENKVFGLPAGVSLDEGEHDE